MSVDQLCMLFTAYVVVYAQILYLKNKLSFLATSLEKFSPPPPSRFLLNLKFEELRYLFCYDFGFSISQFLLLN